MVRSQENRITFDYVDTFNTLNAIKTKWNSGIFVQQTPWLET